MPKPVADAFGVVVTVLLLAAVALLVAAFGTGHAGLAWGSVVLSALVAALILRRWRRSWLQGQDASDESGSGQAAVEVSAPGLVSDQQDACPGEEDLGEEDTDAADLLVVYELTAEVLVIDQHPRYHLDRCPLVDPARAERLAVREVRELGFTPCGRCRPDTTLARKHRAARAPATGSS
ncbi:MAG: hypothetical protein ACRDRS_05705 [Pseudonocardiaceae bacterium]